jgi:hypothetical protein
MILVLALTVGWSQRATGGSSGVAHAASTGNLNGQGNKSSGYRGGGTMAYGRPTPEEISVANNSPLRAVKSAGIIMGANHAVTVKAALGAARPAPGAQVSPALASTAVRAWTDRTKAAGGLPGPAAGSRLLAALPGTGAQATVCGVGGGTSALAGSNLRGMTLAQAPAGLRVATQRLLQSVGSDAWSQQQEFGPFDCTGFLGYSVALSGDGNTALIGAIDAFVGCPVVTGYPHVQGAAFVFTRSGTTWTPQQMLTISDQSADCFGWSVALSGDGNTALIGALDHQEPSNVTPDAAYVFTRSGGTWSQQWELGPFNNFFGYAVALSSDGNTALVGAPLTSQAPIYPYDNGVAYIFTRSGTTWGMQAELGYFYDYQNEFFGDSVALSGDGNTALIGAYGAGVVFVFTRSGTTWGLQQGLSASDPTYGAHFGWSVALSGDGSTALVGADSHQVGSNVYQGVSYLFTRSGTTWGQQQELIASDGAANDHFGISAALSGDGSIAMIGAHQHVVGTTGQGASYLFTRSSTTWGQQQELAASDGASGDYFGWSVALSSDGSTALVGAYGKNTEQGVAYVFAAASATSTPTTTPAPPTSTATNTPVPPTSTPTATPTNTILYSRLDLAHPALATLPASYHFGLWDAASSIQGPNAKLLATTPGTAQQASATGYLYQAGDASPSMALDGEFLSAPLAAQTIPAGPWSVGLGIQGSLLNTGTPDYTGYLILNVINSSNGQVRGTLISAPVGAEKTTEGSEVTAYQAAVQGAAVTVQAGDYLEAEIGVRTLSYSAVQNTTLFTSGATAITTDGAGTTNAETFLQASTALTFQ